MTAERNENLPLLSICVPTFNRARSLDNLFCNLADVKKVHGDRVEICVSDNQSTDHTAEVISEWRDRLDLQVQTQPHNIGGTLNIIAVTRLCRGRWTNLIGDDDEFDLPGLAALLDYLKGAGPDDWVLAGVAGKDGNEQVLRDLATGVYTKAAFRRRMIGTSLYPYGFMGLHVFPASARPVLAGLTLETGQPWPHMATMLRQLETGRVHVFRPAIMVQAASGVHLFWTASALAQITLSKLRILERTSEAVPAHRWFHRAMMIRELYSYDNLVLLLAWRLYEGESFRRAALPAYLTGYRRAGPLALLALPHLALTSLLYVTPHIVLRGLMTLVGRGEYLSRYRDRKSSLKDFNGIERGI